MKRRGLRLEVDQPSDRQERNSHWLAEHPGTSSVTGAVLFAMIGAAYASIHSASWLPLGGVAGLAFGAIIGWGFSIENRREVPRGLTAVLYATAAAIALATLIAMKFAD